MTRRADDFYGRLIKRYDLPVLLDDLTLIELLNRTRLALRANVRARLSRTRQKSTRETRLFFLAFHSTITADHKFLVELQMRHDRFKTTLSNAAGV